MLSRMTREPTDGGSGKFRLVNGDPAKNKSPRAYCSNCGATATDEFGCDACFTPFLDVSVPIDMGVCSQCGQARKLYDTHFCHRCGHAYSEQPG